MFDFAYPHLSILFLLPILIILLYWWSRHSRITQLKKIGDIKVMSSLMPDVSKYMSNIKIIINIIIVIMIVFVLCRPRHGEKELSSSQNGNEIFIALDVSNSMLASSTDDPNGTSRLDKAKLLLEKLITKLDNDKVGLIVFAGESYLQLPITSDFVSAKQYIDIISTDMVPSQGTAIADAIEMAMNAYTADESMHKALILITDSEDHLGDAVSMAKNAYKQNIQVNVIGLGSEKGAPIPINKEKNQFLTDYNGQTITTALNVKLAQDLANAGNGIYVNANSGSALNDITKQLDKLSKSELKTVKYKATAEMFPIFAWIAFILLIIDIFVLEKKISWLKNIHFFSKK